MFNIHYIKFQYWNMEVIDVILCAALCVIFLPVVDLFVGDLTNSLCC